MILFESDAISGGDFILNYSEIPVMEHWEGLEEKEVLGVGPTKCNKIGIYNLGIEEEMFGDNNPVNVRKFEREFLR
jgi:hypothetical protein